MRFPVFGKQADPASTRPILRKKMSYLELQVSIGLARWVDSRDHNKGIVCLSRFACMTTEERMAAFIASGFNHAWKIIPSENMPVWQMRTA